MKYMATAILAVAIATTSASSGWNDFKRKFSKSECLQRIINFSWVRGDMSKDC